MRTTIAFALMAIFALPAFADEAKEKEGKKEAKEKKEKEGKGDEKKETPKYPKAPAFKAKGTDGKEYSLKQFEGKIVVLEWGDHNCPWVKRHYSQGAMQALQKKYTAEDKGVVWLVIASTDPKHVAYLEPAAIDKKNAEYKAAPTATLMDADGSIGRAYKAKTTPHMFVIDKKGEIVYSGAPDNLRETGNKDDLKSNKSHVSEVLDALLAGKTPETKSTEPYG
jgi:peroxiredoxin